MTTQNWNFDAAHSEVGFNVKHMMLAKVRGKFTDWSGEFRFDPENAASAFVRAEIDVATITTGNGQRDDHLRSADFFDAENHPKMVFESTKWKPTDYGFDVIGSLTIRGTTKPVTVRVESNGIGTDPWGNTRVGFSATTRLNRKEFGLTWNQALETGGVLVGEDVNVEIEVQAVQAEASDEVAA